MVTDKPLYCLVTLTAALLLCDAIRDDKKGLENLHRAVAKAETEDLWTGRLREGRRMKDR